MDVGAGVGAFSVYMALRGTDSVYALEPECDGSQQGMQTKFDRLVQQQAISNVRLDRRTLEQVAATLDAFDVVLLHNCINHFDEVACAKLRVDPEAVRKYDSIFASLYRVTKPGGVVIIADGSRRNLWNDLGFRNPLCSTIEWHIHQLPESRSGIAKRHGYEPRSVRWTSLGHLGWVGRILCGNWLISYYTLSHSSIVLHRPAN